MTTFLLSNAQALEAYTEAARCGPGPGCLANTNLAMSLTDLGTRLKMMGDVASAVVYYKQALTHDANYAPTYFNLGVVLSEANKYEAALEYYLKALSINPKYIQVRAVAVGERARSGLGGS